MKKKSSNAASSYISGLFTETGPKSKKSGGDEPKGKSLSKTESQEPTSKLTQGQSAVVKNIKEKSDASELALAKKRANQGMAKFAAGSAATAASMYYGLTKEIGGNVQRDASGREQGRTRKRRVPIWSKEE